MRGASTLLGVLVGLTLAAGACGSGEGEAADETTVGAGGGAGGETGQGPPAGAEDPRVLGAGATFGELVAAARRLDDRAESDSDAGCILRGRAGEPWRLEADLSVAVRPLPDAPADLDERVADGDAPLRALTRWGQLASVAGEPVLVAFTSTPPLRATAGVALVLTDRGVYLRRVGESRVEPFGPVPLGEVRSRLGEALGQAAPPVFVTAEAGTELSRLRALLDTLPPSVSGATALAVPLAPETRIPDPGVRRADDTGLCPEGLPPREADATDGVLAPQQMIDSLGPLRQGARACFDNATGEAATGGRLVLSFRVGPTGEVTEVCFPEDEVADPGLRACVAEAARATRFPAPDPPGFVDASVPLLFAPDDSLRQRPLCP